MAALPCMLEPYSAAPSRADVRDCLLKLFTLHAHHRREFRRKKKKRRLPEKVHARAWLLTPTASKPFLTAFGAQGRAGSKWPTGFYFLPEGLHTAIVVIHHLPRTPATLWLRLLGRGAVQRQAIEEVLSLPRAHPLRKRGLTYLPNWRLILKNKLQLSGDEREVMMNLGGDFDDWEREAEERGIEKEAWQLQRCDQDH